MEAFTTLTSTEIRRDVRRLGGKHDPSQTLIHDRAIFAQSITLAFARNEVYTRFRFISFFFARLILLHFLTPPSPVVIINYVFSFNNKLTQSLFSLSSPDTKFYVQTTYKFYRKYFTYFARAILVLPRSSRYDNKRSYCEKRGSSKKNPRANSN